MVARVNVVSATHTNCYNIYPGDRSILPSILIWREVLQYIMSGKVTVYASSPIRPPLKPVKHLDRNYNRRLLGNLNTGTRGLLTVTI